MSDDNRKHISTQIAERATPEEHKTLGERAKERITDAWDKVKAAVTPDSEKSLTQQAADKTRGHVDSHE